MNKKKFIVFFGCCFAAILVFSVVRLFLIAKSSEENATQTSEKKFSFEYIEFGSYPQSEVKDEVLLKELEQQELNWISYGYYSGDGTLGSMTPGDYMKYADVNYNGERYRAVIFSEYRPHCNHIINKVTTMEDRFSLNTVYWFKYEPIRWIVLDKNTGFVMTEKIIDSQPVNDTIYCKNFIFFKKYYSDSQLTVSASDYSKSSIRTWLNGEFYETAFSNEEKNSISATVLDNSAWSRKYSRFDSESTTDNIFLLSYSEVTDTSYGFSSQAEKSDTLRIAYPTDYALCQGVYTVKDFDNIDGSSWWLLRSGSYREYEPGDVAFTGAVFYHFYIPYYADSSDSGIRPGTHISDINAYL